MSDFVAGAAALKCLVISDGRSGIENQALGLAEACAASRPLKIETHHVSAGGVLSALPAKLRAKLTPLNIAACDIAIGCGRRTVPTLLRVKRERPTVFTVYVQDPRLDPTHFDLVVAPEHDLISGPNVITMIGSPNRVTAERLENEARSFADKLAAYPKPRALFLIGGKSKTHHLSDADHMFHVKQAQNLMAKGYAIFVTTSRRTPKAAKKAWHDFAKTQEAVWFYNGEGPNPYFAFLNAADVILATEDSTNMLTEACATGTPLSRLPMSGEPGKFQMLYDALEIRCGVIRYQDGLGGQAYSPLTETQSAAQKLWDVYDARS